MTAIAKEQPGSRLIDVLFNANTVTGAVVLQKTSA